MSMDLGVNDIKRVQFLFGAVMHLSHFKLSELPKRVDNNINQTRT